MTVTTAARRVATFTSQEVQEQVTAGEWMRQPDLSTDSLDSQINKFLRDSKAVVVFVSTPSIEELKLPSKRVKDKCPPVMPRRMFRTSVSIIYQPEEIVIDEVNQIQENPRVPIEKAGQELARQLSGISGSLTAGLRARQARTNPRPTAVPSNVPSRPSPAVPAFRHLPGANQPPARGT